MAQILEHTYLVPEFTMITHSELSDQKVRQLIRESVVTLAGNKKLRIFGKLSCRSGKRMKKINRAFFSDAEEAVSNQFRPCGHCMKAAYNKWKNESLQ